MKLFIGSIIAVVALMLNTTDALNVKLYGVNYSVRKGPEWAPDDEKCKTQAQVQTEMETLATITDRVRINSLLSCNASSLVLPAAKKVGIHVHLGIWMTKDQEQVQQEKDHLSSLINSGLYDDNVIALDVGSQAISLEQIDANVAITQLEEVRALLRGHGHATPVTMAETIEVYMANPKLIDAVDFVSVMYFSIWERAHRNEGVSVTLDRLRDLRMSAAKANKATEIAETGWSSGGTDPNAGDASMENQAKFLSDMYQVNVASQLNFYWYSAYDQPWRVKPIESMFGLLSVNNTLKPNIEQLNITVLDSTFIKNDKTGLCLSESAGQVYMYEKSKEWMATEEQVWSWNPVTQQLRCQSNFRCLDAYQRQDRGLIHMFSCIDTEPNQKWTYDNVTNQLQHVSHVGFCLDIDTERSNRIQLLTCSNTSPTQKWTFSEGSSA